MNLKELKIDLNTLFHFNFNFDSLKIMIETLHNNQNEIIMKINDLETKVNNHNQTITETYNKVIQFEKSEENEEEIQTESKVIDTNHEKTVESKVKDSHDVQLEEQKIENYCVTIQNIDQDQSKKVGDFINFTKNSEIIDLKNRVTKIEKNIKQMSYTKPSLNHQETIILSKRKSSELDNNVIIQIKEMNEKLNALSFKFEEMSCKVNDINISDLLNECRAEGGGLDVSKALVYNLEQKIFKKFAFVDEKNKQIFDEQFKINKSLNDIKMKNEVNNFEMEQIGKRIQVNSNEIEDIQSNIDKSNSKINDILNKQQNSFTEANKEIKQLGDIVKLLKDQFDIINKEVNRNGITLQENDLQMIKDIYKRVNDLEKNLQHLGQSLNLEVMRDDIKTIKLELYQKSNNSDIFDLNDKMTLQSNVITTLKDINEKLIEDRNKLCADSNLMMKKVESLNAAVIAMRANEDNALSTNKINAIDTTKYLEIAVFNEFIKTNTKEQEKLNKEFEELRRSVNEITISLNTKASDEDMKNMEACFIAKLEEMKLFMNKKFADKYETSKNIKYLDTQLKHIIEFYMKKNEKGENWLLAKKPIGGFSCASCETYIGELPEKKEYLAWNKYPMRETQDKAYRIGNGYSKLLGMLSVDIKNPEGGSCDNQSDSDGEAKNNQPNLSKRSHLPNIAISRLEENGNMSIDLNENLLHRTVDPNDPKVVKIIKKARNSSMDLSRNVK